MLETPVARITDGGEWPDMGAKNWYCALGKSTEC